MGWWKKMVKESVGNTEVRSHDDYKDVEVRDYADSIYDDQSPPKEEEWEDVKIEDEPKVEVKMVKPLDLMKVQFKASPNKSTRKGEVEFLVLHHTGPGSFNGIVNWLCNKDAHASAHYVLGTAGQLKQLVNTGKEAWHAGVARHKGVQINNHKSIGIEICNIGRMEQGDDGTYYYEQGRKTKKYTGKAQPVGATIVYPWGNAVSGFAVPYPEKQVDKLVALCKAIVEKYPAITRDNILTHYEIGSPEGRKNDPFGLDVESVKNMIFG